MSRSNRGWFQIETVPENKRVYVYGWHVNHSPPYDEEAMAWKDRMDGRWYYAPQGGLIDWTPTHWRNLHAAPALVGDVDK